MGLNRVSYMPLASIARAEAVSPAAHLCAVLPCLGTPALPQKGAGAAVRPVSQGEGCLPHSTTHSPLAALAQARVGVRSNACEYVRKNAC